MLRRSLQLLCNNLQLLVNSGSWNLAVEQLLVSGRVIVLGTRPELYTWFAAENTRMESMEFRYVIIPGGTAAGYSIQQIKGMSYAQVTSLFKIPANGTNQR